MAKRAHFEEQTKQQIVESDGDSSSGIDVGCSGSKSVQFDAVEVFYFEREQVLLELISLRNC